MSPWWTHNTDACSTVTPLHTQTMPLLRFSTGDMVKQLDGICSCGSSSKRYSAVIGRKQQLLKVKGTSFYPQQCFEALGNLKFNFDYGIKASTNSFGNDAVEILVENNLKSAQINQIKDALQAAIRVSPSIKQLPKIELQELLYPKHSRKPVRFIDKR